MQRRIHIVTFGCQMNKFDSEIMAQLLVSAGHETVDTPEEADTVIFSTCSVRQQAENRVLSAIGVLKKRKEENPAFLIGVTGCMAQRLGEKLIRQYPAIDFVVGTRMFQNINEIMEDALSGPVVAVEEQPLASKGILPQHRHTGGHHGYIAAMRGCNNFCTYCIVPYVRGREESRPEKDIIAEARQMLESGAKEITLLGQSVNAYGHDLDPESSLAELLHKTCALEGLKRLRFISNHPKDVTRELFEAIAENEKVCEHLHMPAQSGSNRMLEAMNRKYTREHYDSLMQMGSGIVPGIGFASDFIVGFPGETESDFLATLDLVEKTRYQNIFAFRYSPRPGTKAADMPDNVPQEEKERRLQTLLKAQEAINTERNSQLAARGAVIKILIEGISKKDNRKLTGRTPQNAIVVVDAPNGDMDAQALIGKELEVRINNYTPLTLFGEILG